MTTVNCYLAFDGKCEAAFNFYKEVFGGELACLVRYKDMPAGEGYEINEKYNDYVLHTALPISGETMLLGCDATEGYQVGNNISISVTPENEVECKRIFNALAEGGTIIQPLEKSFWGSLFGMTADRFGITWLVDYKIED
jgi:PhnB protein